MPIQGKLGAVYVSDGNASTTFTDEATTKNANYTQYKITAQAKRFWDDGTPVTVKKNGSVITTGFTIDYAGGVINFTAPNIVSDTILVSGKYFTVVQCATFFNWKLDINADMKDVTTFSSNGWKEQIALIKSWSGSCEGFWADATYLGLMGKRIIMCLYVDSTTGKRYEGYLLLKKNSLTQPVDDVVKEGLDFEGTGELEYHEL